MCWNASVSINTYIFSTFACIFAYMNDVLDFSSAMLLQSVFIIQLFEYFVWSKTFPNRLLSQIGLGIIMSQPLFSILRLSSSNIYRQYLIGAYTLYLIVLYTIVDPLNKVDFRTVPHENGHLAWNWIPSNEIAIIWVIFLLLPSLISGWYRGAFIGTFMFLITFLLYSDTKTWGSLWCWASNIIGVFLIFDVFWKDFCAIPEFRNMRSIFASKISPDFVR